MASFSKEACLIFKFLKFQSHNLLINKKNTDQQRQMEIAI